MEGVVEGGGGLMKIASIVAVRKVEEICRWYFHRHFHF